MAQARAAASANRFNKTMVFNSPKTKKDGEAEKIEGKVKSGTSEAVVESTAAGDGASSTPTSVVAA